MNNTSTSEQKFRSKTLLKKLRNLDLGLKFDIKKLSLEKKIAKDIFSRFDSF